MLIFAILNCQIVLFMCTLLIVLMILLELVHVCFLCHCFFKIPSPSESCDISCT